MKISPLLGSVNFLNLGGKASVARDNARADKDGENGRDQYTRQQTDEENSGGQGTPEQQKQKTDDAVEAFHLDPHAQASGLTASTEGNGPGLKVVVKDSGGGVIRQFTGEEFLRLREAVSQDKKGRGKILDQKF